MKLRVEVVWENEGEEQRSDVMAIDRPQLAMETLGLNLGESKAMLEGVQDIVVARWDEGRKDAVWNGEGG